MDTSLTVSEGLEVLRATGCMPSLLTGDAILTEKTLARALIDMEEHLEVTQRANSKKCTTTSLPSRVLDRFKQQYQTAFAAEEKKEPRKGFSLSPSSLGFHYVVFEDDRRDFPYASLDGFTSPWTAYREGIPYQHGHNMLVRGKTGLSAGEFLDISVEPTFLRDGTSKFQSNLHSGHLKLTWRNAQMKIGRSPVLWGQGRDKRVLFSENTKPLELIELGSPQSLQLPWFLKHLGPFQYRLFWTVLDKDQHFPHVMIFGGRIMMKPLHNLEFGLSRAVVFGGSGASDFFPLEPIAELVGLRWKSGRFLMIPFKKEEDAPTDFNNVLGMDARWRIPTLRQSEIFLDIYDEDPLDFGGWDFFLENTVFHGGVWIPHVDPDGEWRLLLEASHARTIPYTHATNLSGLSHQRRVLGLDSGPAATEYHVWISRLIGLRMELWGETTYIHYDRLPDSGRGVAKETRLISRLGSTLSMTQHLLLRFSGGFQHIEHFDFRNENKNVVMGDAALQYQF